MLALGGTQNDAVVPAAFARLWKIPIAGGYGPIIKHLNALKVHHLTMEFTAPQAVLLGWTIA